MRVIKRNNQIKYKYEKEKWSEGVKLSVLLYILSIFIFFLSIVISIIKLGNASEIIGGLGLASIICCLGSMSFSISEIYLYKRYKRITRNMLLFQILYLLYWVFSL